MPRVSQPPRWTQPAGTRPDKRLGGATRGYAGPRGAHRSHTSSRVTPRAASSGLLSPPQVRPGLLRFGGRAGRGDADDVTVAPSPSRVVACATATSAAAAGPSTAVARTLCAALQLQAIALAYTSRRSRIRRDDQSASWNSLPRSCAVLVSVQAVAQVWMLEIEIRPRSLARATACCLRIRLDSCRFHPSFSSLARLTLAVPALPPYRRRHVFRFLMQLVLTREHCFISTRLASALAAWLFFYQSQSVRCRPSLFSAC